jgi:hypothetical protein
MGIDDKSRRHTRRADDALIGALHREHRSATTGDDGREAHPDHAEQVVASALVADLGIPIGTVRSRAFYALRSLRHVLDGDLAA